jgi:putative glutamine amidotransferase
VAALFYYLKIIIFTPKINSIIMTHKLIILVAFVFLTLSSFAQELILFSKADKGGTYMTFIHNVDSSLVLKSSYGQPTDSINLWLSQASGIIITGGRDIHPSIYGKVNEVEKCGEFDRYRDSLELKMVAFAKNNKIPLLGICRGHQMLNVALGGTLYTDIPTDIANNLSHRNADNPPIHEISIESESLLAKIIGAQSCSVNSYHHQCADKLGKNLSVMARTSDGVVESIIYKAQDWTALGVQFHPEKMNFNHPCAGSIGKWFITQIK